jgi:hypothetical protein
MDTTGADIQGELARTVLDGMRRLGPLSHVTVGCRQGLVLAVEPQDVGGPSEESG